MVLSNGMTAEAPTGAWLFRYRSFLPVPLALILVLVRRGAVGVGCMGGDEYCLASADRVPATVQVKPPLT